MATNAWPVIVPCHRVVGARGEPGGFSAYGGLTTKERMLQLEGGSLAPALQGSLFDERD
jgi:methylated-DNA-[protein]-cysteine S-methyltransferase